MPISDELKEMLLEERVDQLTAEFQTEFNNIKRLTGLFLIKKIQTTGIKWCPSSERRLGQKH
jgi:hypothetical protein